MQSDTDEYFRKALIEGYRARSAYKLLQIDKSFDLLKDAKNVIDLCSAPGSWSQVISNKLHNIRSITSKDKIQLEPNIKIASVDLAPIKPIPGVTSLVGDITDVKTCEKLSEIFGNEKVDVIVCDGAHDVSGLVEADFQLHLGLITACIYIILHTLKTNGSFVAKIFDTWGCQIFLSQFRVLFKEVYVVKPHSSRSESYECFVVCKQYASIKDFNPSQLSPYLDGSYRDFSNLTGIDKYYIPFFVLGHVDIIKSEFDELYKTYGSDLYEKHDLLEEAFREDDLAGFNVDGNNENWDDHQKFFKNNLLNRSNVNFGVSRKLFITYLKEDCTVDFYQSISFGEKSFIDINNIEKQQSSLKGLKQAKDEVKKDITLNTSNLKFEKATLKQESAIKREDKTSNVESEHNELIVKMFNDLILKDDANVEKIKTGISNLEAIINTNDEKESKSKNVKEENVELEQENLCEKESNLDTDEINLEKDAINLEKLILNCPEKSEMDKEKYLLEVIKDHEFVTKLFDEFAENNEINETLSSDNNGNHHPWFSKRNLEDDKHLFEDFKLETITENADEEIMKAIRETNDVLPKGHELTDKVLLLVNPNEEVLKLVEKRKNLLEEIQKYVN
ncbi:uncharacterized protein [Onthophagus taurus]|uniref:uncharacterized protein n=1 Tax=Onthophagus taurus TaxID=166361 RepID=UPI0039BDDF4B